MTWTRLRFVLLSLAACTATVPVATLHAEGSPLEVVELRTDGFPRVVARLKATQDDESAVDSVSPDRLRVIENGEPQPSAEILQIRNPAVPTSVALAVDVSGSMADEDKLTQARSAASGFLQQMRPKDQIALVSFSDEVIVPQALTRDRNLLARAVDNLQAGGNTRLYDAVAQGLTQLSLSPSGARALIVLTDGNDTASERSVDDDVAQAVRMAVPVYAIGLGSDADTAVLQRLATTTGGRYYFAPTGRDLTEVFRRITRQLTSQYEVSWVSTTHPVSGEELSVQISIAGRSDTSLASEASFTYQSPAFGRAPRAEPDNPVRALVDVAATTAPSQEQTLAAGMVAGASALLLFFGLIRRRVNRRMRSRLSTFVAGRPQPGVEDAISKISSRRTRLNPLTAVAARITARIIPSQQVKRLRRKLIQAGHPSDRQLSFFLAAELALAILLGAGAYEMLQITGSQRSGMSLIALVALFSAFGMYMPYMWLRRRVEWRQRQLMRALPDALDLMSISVTAGLSLDSAMTEVVQKWDGELSREFNQVLNEMRMGGSRRQALRNLAERTQLQDIQLLVAALLQADELGSNIAETLSVQSKQLRIRRRQLAEEKARKAPVKMLVPLVGFIFPAMFVVVLAPGFLQIFAVLKAVSHHG
jgi:tight adherence protein C